MSLKIDHITLGHMLSQLRAKCLKLAAVASAGYPKKDPFVRDLFALTRAVDLLKSELDTVCQAEVSDSEFSKLGHPYYPLRDPDHAEPDIGIAIYRPQLGNRKPRFSSDEILAARRCLVEIGEGLEYARGLVSGYGTQHRVQAVLRYAKARNRLAGSHVGLSPDTATEMA